LQRGATSPDPWRVAVKSRDVAAFACDTDKMYTT
jgi:hypothetical protein